MRQAALVAQLVIVGDHVVAFGLRQRTAIGAGGEFQHGIKVLRFGLCVQLFETAECGVDAVEVFDNGAGGERTGLRIGGRFGEVLRLEIHDDGLVRHFLADGTGRAAFVALAGYFTALVEVILDPGALGPGGDVIEFLPELIDFFDALFVEDEFAQRGIVAIVAHHIVIARAEEAALILGVIGEVAAAFGDEEGVREDAGEAGKRRLVFFALGFGDDEVLIAYAGLVNYGGPMRRAILMKAGVTRDGGHGRGGIFVIAERGGVAIAVVRGELLELPVHEGFGAAG